MLATTLAALRASIRRAVARRGERPRIVVPDHVQRAQPTAESTTRSTSPSYVNLMAPLPAPAPRQAPHDAVVDLREHG